MLVHEVSRLFYVMHVHGMWDFVYFGMVMHGDACSNEYAQDLVKYKGFIWFFYAIQQCQVRVFESMQNDEF